MRIRIVILSLLLTVPYLALAQWQPIQAGQSDAPGAYYVALAKDFAEGSPIRRVWLLFDRAQGATTSQVRSSASLLEFDCSTPAVRLLEFVTYGDAMGRGRELLRSRESTDWESVPDGSTVRAAHTLVCHSITRQTLSQ